MTFRTDAIYEAGVLRPLGPLELAEHQVVSLVVSTSSEQPLPEAKAVHQREILMAHVAKVEARPDETPQDGYSNRDHDLLIYGK